MKKPPKEHDPTNIRTLRKRANLEAVKKLLARGMESLDIANTLKLPLRTIQDYRREIMNELGEDLINRTVIDYAAKRQVEIDGVVRSILDRFYEAVDRRDVKAMCMLGYEWRETRDKELKWMQGLGLVHKEPARVMAAVRFEEVFDSLPEAILRAIAEAETPDRSMEIFRLEIGEEKAKQIFEPVAEKKMLPAGKR